MQSNDLTKYWSRTITPWQSSVWKIKRMEVDERSTADRVALSFRPAGVPSVPQKSASAMDIFRTSIRRKTLVFLWNRGYTH